MNNKMVPMAVLDLIWMGISYAALLAFVAIMGFIVFKVGIISFKIAMDVVGAAKGIENIEGVIKPDYRIATEKHEIEIIGNFINASIQKNHRAKYVYDLFKVGLMVPMVISNINSLNDFYESRTEKTYSHINSLKSFIESKHKTNFAKYAYIQLFKK